jgi:hypothetical protein
MDAEVSTEDDDTARVPKPPPITDAARRLQSRLWSVTCGLNKALSPLDVASWVSTLYAEYGQLLMSREPILQWPHFEPTRPRTGVVINTALNARLPPLLWLLLLDDTRCVTVRPRLEPINKAPRGPLMACLALMVREHGLSLEDKYVHIAEYGSYNGLPSECFRFKSRPLSFLMEHFEDTRSSLANLRALLTLGACHKTPLDYDINEHGEHQMKSALYYALTSSTGLDAAQVLLDFGARLDPALDGGIMFHAVRRRPCLERYQRLMSLFELNRAALRGMENVHATVKRVYERITTDIGVFHELVKVYAEEGTERQDHAHIDSITAMFHGLHTRVGVSLLIPARCIFWNDEGDNDAPPLPVLEYVRGLHQKQALDHDDRDDDDDTTSTTKKQHCARLQRLIEFIEPLDRAERFSLRPLATAAELSLKWSPKFGGLTPELRRMVLRHVLAWAVQLQL